MHVTGTTILGLAAASGIPGPQISRYRAGDNVPNVGNAGLLAESLGMTVDEVFASHIDEARRSRGVK